MVTIKDIAKLAGVSQATVSNVLNGKGNVSSEKIKLVLEVARQAGYSINAQAKKLRSAPGDPGNTIAVILPNVAEKKFTALYETVKDCAENQNMTVLLFTTWDLPQEEQAILDLVAAMRVGGVVSVTCVEDAAQAYRALKQLGAKVVFALRRPGNGDCSVTFDYYEAGKAVAKRAITNETRVIGLLDSPGTFSPCREFEQGIHDYIQEARLPFAPLLRAYQGPLISAAKTATAFFTGENIPDLFICTSAEYTQAVLFAREITGAQKEPALVALADYSIVDLPENCLKYRLDYRSLGRRAVQLLIEEMRGAAPPGDRSQILEPIGFRSTATPTPLTKPVTLNVLLMKGQAAKAVEIMSGRLAKASNIRLNVVTMSPEEIYQKCMTIADDDFFDVVRVSISALPLLERRAFVPFAREEHSRITSGMIERIVEPMSMIGGAAYAVPFDVGCQVLVYRKDILGDPMVRRMFFETYGIPLELPDNYESYNRIVEFFNQERNPSSPVRYGASVSLGTDSELFTCFAHRYGGLIGDLLNRSESGGFNVFAACAAIENFKQFYQVSCKIEDDSWFGAAHDNFVKGLSAMETIAFNYASDITELYTLAVNRQIGYRIVPGGSPCLGGGSLLIRERCRDYAAALQFVQWACGAETAEVFTYLGGVSPHKRAYENQEVLDLYPWYNLLTESLNCANTRELWDHYHVHKLEQLVSEALRDVVADKKTPEAAASFIGNRLYTCKLH